MIGQKCKYQNTSNHRPNCVTHNETIIVFVESSNTANMI